MCVQQKAHQFNRKQKRRQRAHGSGQLRNIFKHFGWRMNRRRWRKTLEFDIRKGYAPHVETTFFQNLGQSQFLWSLYHTLSNINRHLPLLLRYHILSQNHACVALFPAKNQCQNGVDTTQQEGMHLTSIISSWRKNFLQWAKTQLPPECPELTGALDGQSSVTTYQELLHKKQNRDEKLCGVWEVDIQQERRKKVTRRQRLTWWW